MQATKTLDAIHKCFKLVICIILYHQLHVVHVISTHTCLLNFFRRRISDQSFKVFDEIFSSTDPSDNIVCLLICLIMYSVKPNQIAHEPKFHQICCDSEWSL